MMMMCTQMDRLRGDTDQRHSNAGSFQDILPARSWEALMSLWRHMWIIHLRTSTMLCISPTKLITTIA